jgi:preprotein translocase subunit SecB
MADLELSDEDMHELAMALAPLVFPFIRNELRDMLLHVAQAVLDEDDPDFRQIFGNVFAESRNRDETRFSQARRLQVGRLSEKR